MITGRVCRNSFGSFLRGQFHHCVGSSSGFESADFLEVFALKIDLATCDFIDRGGGHDWGAVDKRLDAGMRRADIREGREIHGLKIGEGKQSGNTVEIQSKYTTLRFVKN